MIFDFSGLLGRVTDGVQKGASVLILEPDEKPAIDDIKAAVGLVAWDPVARAGLEA